MSIDPWSAPLAVLALVALAAWLVHGCRERFAGWGWWRPGSRSSAGGADSPER